MDGNKELRYTNGRKKAGGLAVPALCQNPICLADWGWLSSEKQMPQVIGNKQNRREAIAQLELSRELAKQVLLQLSYTPSDLTS